MATFWERAAHSVDHMLVFVILGISRFGFEGGIWVLIVPVSGYCLRVCLFFTYLSDVCLIIGHYSSRLSQCFFTNCEMVPI